MVGIARPDDTHAIAWHLIQPLQPYCAPSRIGLNVGHGCRNRSDFGTENSGQAHQVDVIVKRRVVAVAAQNLADPRERPRQYADATPDLQENACTKGLDVRCIADELENIAKALLGS